MCSVLTVLVAAILGIGVTQAPSVLWTESPAQVDSSACEPTLPNGMTPPAEDASVQYHGNGALYTALWPAGEFLADPALIEPDGSVGVKFPWWRAPGVWQAGDLEISGHDVTTGEPIAARIPSGYGQRFQATSIHFPAQGCYEIIGRSGDASLTIIAKVVV